MIGLGSDKNRIISSTWYQTSSLHRRQKREVAWYNSRKSWYQLRSLVIMWYFNLLNHKLPYDTNLVWIWVDLERESLGGQWPGAGRDPDVEKDRPLLLIDQSAPPTPNLVHLNLILPHFSDCTHTHQQIQIRKRMKIQKFNSQHPRTTNHTIHLNLDPSTLWILSGFFPISWTAINTHWQTQIGEKHTTQT